MPIPRDPTHRALSLSLVFLLTACGGSTGLGHREPPTTRTVAGAELRVVTTGDTARSAFHEATRLFSLGDAGFVAAAPTDARFYSWEGAPLGAVPLARGFWLAGTTSDGEVLVVEPTSDEGGASTVFTLRADGVRTPRPDIPTTIAGGGTLSPNGAAFVGRLGDGLTIVPATGGPARRLATLGDPDARFAWAPDVGHLAVIDTMRGRTSLYVLDVHGTRGEDLLSGADLAENPGGALAWRSQDAILVRRGGGTFHDSQIVQVRIGDGGRGIGRARTLLDVPGSVSSIAAHGRQLAFVSVTSHRSMALAPLVAGGGMGSATTFAEGDYVRPLGMLSGGRAALVARDEPGARWVVQIAHDGTTDVVAQLAQAAEVVACTDGAESLVFLRARAGDGVELVVLSGGRERIVPVAPELSDRLEGVEAIACAGGTCVLRSRLRDDVGAVLDLVDLATGAAGAPSCAVRGWFGPATGVALTADGTHALLAGSVLDLDEAGAREWLADPENFRTARQGASRVDLAACTGEAWPVPGTFVQYAQASGDAMIVSGEEWRTGQWGLWRVSADGVPEPLSVGPERLNRPFVGADGASILFGQQHVVATVLVWTAPEP